MGGIIIPYGAATDSSYATISLIQQLNKNLRVELEPPDSSEVGKTNVFKIRFLDEQNFPQGHVDYRYHIIKDGSAVTSSIIHSESGITSFSYNFDSSGSYEVAIDVEGILFQPISPETARFSIAVTPEFPITMTAAISGISIMAVLLVRRS